MAKKTKPTGHSVEKSKGKSVTEKSSIEGAKVVIVSDPGRGSRQFIARIKDVHESEELDVYKDILEGLVAVREDDAFESELMLEYLKLAHETLEGIGARLDRLEKAAEESGAAYREATEVR